MKHRKQKRTAAKLYRIGERLFTGTLKDITDDIVDLTPGVNDAPKSGTVHVTHGRHCSICGKPGHRSDQCAENKTRKENSVGKVHKYECDSGHPFQSPKNIMDATCPVVGCKDRLNVSYATP